MLESLPGPSWNQGLRWSSSPFPMSGLDLSFRLGLENSGLASHWLVCRTWWSGWLMFRRSMSLAEAVRCGMTPYFLWVPTSISCRPMGRRLADADL